MSIISSQRYLFDVPSQVGYFNSAYLSPQLNASRNRLFAGVRGKSHPWERSAASFFDDAETIRKLSAELFGGDADGYAVVAAASYGLSSAARAIEPTLKAGDGIVVMAEEFPSNVLPWKASAGQSGASVVTVPIPRDGEWTRAVVERIDRNTRVVAVSGCHWTNGAAIDLAEVGKAARAVGAALVVDASQSLGARPFSVEQIKPDFLVAAGYKWLLGPYGFALMYVSERWRNARPLEESWLARQGTDDFASLVACSDQYRPGARRFDVGEKCVPTILPGAIAALEQIRSWGIGNIAASLARINARIAVELGTLGFQLPPEAQRCPHMFGALAPKSLARNWVVELRKRDLYISQRGNALRFSPHLHVNDDDLGRLLESLRELAKA